MENKANNNTENTGERSFAKAYEDFHPIVRKEIYNKIMGWTGWSRMTFYNKKNQVYPLRPLEAGIIEQIFLDYGVNAWTGKEVEAEV
ncbi:MAG: hypothetical protein M0P69_12715 [Bacteroidales bacterium]|nr:hypothetical protein [Bacteroidales bacterium]